MKNLFYRGRHRAPTNNAKRAAVLAAAIAVPTSTAAATPADAAQPAAKPISVSELVARQAAEKPADTLTVRPGDTLSKLAAPRGTTWQHLFEMNRDVVEDPDLIFPGDVLDTKGHPLVGDEPPAVRPAKAEPEADDHEVTKVAAVEKADEAKPPPGVSRRLAEQSSSGFDGVRSHVARAGHLIQSRFGVESVLGVGSRGNKSDHPVGKALDFMVRGSRGDQIAEFALAHQDMLNVKYVIWEQRINHGSGWEHMEDRGGDTANHMDHVHVSFN